MADMMWGYVAIRVGGGYGEAGHAEHELLGGCAGVHAVMDLCHRDLEKHTDVGSTTDVSTLEYHVSQVSEGRKPRPFAKLVLRPRDEASVPGDKNWREHFEPVWHTEP